VDHLTAELDRQVARLLQLDYPGFLGADRDGFLALLKPLRELVPGLVGSDDDAGSRPFVVVISVAPERIEDLMARVSLGGKAGFVKLFPKTTADFRPIVAVPAAAAYLLTAVDTGSETLNVTPREAFQRIAAEGRSPLTIAEGVAVVTQFPDVLRTANSFSLLGSRCQDKRVPAIWATSRGQPRLGWCWEGNPHSWLGSASCRDRLGGRQS